MPFGSRQMKRDTSTPEATTRELLIPHNVNRNWRRGRYLYHYFPSDQPLTYAASAGGVQAFPTASQGQINYIRGGSGHNSFYAEMYQSTAQTLMPTLDATNGLEIALDQVDNETVEYVIGGNNAFNPYAMVVGTDSDFFLRAKFKLDDASFSDQFGIMWRKQEAFQVPTSFLSTGDALYTDFALFGFAGTKADPNVVRISTDIGNAGSSVVTSTGFTWADAKVHTLEIRVVGRKARYYINDVEVGSGSSISKDGDGAALTAQSTTPAAAYSFTSGLTLVPCIFVRQDADVGHVYLRELSCGHLSMRGLDPSNE